MPNEQSKRTAVIIAYVVMAVVVFILVGLVWFLIDHPTWWQGT